MKCIKCGNKMVEIILDTYKTRWRDFEYTVKNVYANKCCNCEYMNFEPEEIKRIQNIVYNEYLRQQIENN